MHGGYPVSPASPSFTPYNLNNAGMKRQTAFSAPELPALEKLNALDPDQWNKLAQEHKIIPSEAALHSFQVQIANRILMRMGDALVIAPTGQGKSLLWTLPLLAWKAGISLVITPYTSLGIDGQLVYVVQFSSYKQANGPSQSNKGLSSVFIYFE
jgi:hypothetical protein